MTLHACIHSIRVLGGAAAVAVALLAGLACSGEEGELRDALQERLAEYDAVHDAWVASRNELIPGRPLFPPNTMRARLEEALDAGAEEERDRRLELLRQNVQALDGQIAFLRAATERNRASLERRRRRQVAPAASE